MLFNSYEYIFLFLPVTLWVFFRMVVNHAWHALRRGLGWNGAETRGGRWAARLLTFVAVVVAWVFFRAESWQTATGILAGMFGLNGVLVEQAYFGQWPSAVALSMSTWQSLCRPN